MTVKEWLEHLANSDASEDKDSRMMQNLLRKIGFPNAVVVLGIVYVEGKGTIEAPPMSIHSMAKIVLKGSTR